MRVTEVRVNLVGEGERDGLQAYCAITLDSEFVVHDVKVIRLGDKYIVSMPSRKLKAACLQCRESNHLRARFCNNCGERLPENRQTDRVPKHMGPRVEAVEARNRGPVYHIDIAHPITRPFRADVEAAVVAAYRRELAIVTDGIEAEESFSAGV